MSTDDSISEDVSSSGALSHCHVSADGDVGKESETSLVSSEGTSASGLAVSEHRHTISQTTGASVACRPMDITPACNKIRSLCLSTDEAFSQGKNLPFINPSSLETLRALVQEIQSSGETNPEIWKDCEGRWLHLFQLVEKQYQEQILAQQEQYQCQIQLIQDEIKALVQLQNRQSHAEFAPTLMTKTPTKEYILPLVSSDCTISKNVPIGNDSLAVPAHTPFSSPSPPLRQPETVSQGDERPTTMLSSGYGTLSTWETGPEPAGSPEEQGNGRHMREQHHWSSKLPDETEITVIGFQLDESTRRTVEAQAQNPLVHQQRTCGTNQLLTSWAQRQKLRAEKTKTGQSSPQIPEYQEELRITRDFHRESPLENRDSQEQIRLAGPSSSSCSLRRSDSLLSETSGLTYWRRNENDLYRLLPDNVTNGTYFLLQEASTSLTPPQEPRLSLREIYKNKQRTDCKRADCEGSVTSSLLSPRVLTLDPDVNLRHSDCTSGFTSPSNFSSPALTTQPNFFPRVATPVTPDSMVECSPNTGDTDCISDTSCISGAGPSPSKVKKSWRNASQTVLHNVQDKTHRASKHSRASAPLASEEEGSHTHTSTLKPCPADGAALQPEASTHMDDPVVLSLIRQNLREKHSRHVADLKAYYESEIRMLRDKLKLTGLPKDLEKSNQVLTDRCKHLEKSLAEAVARIQDLDAKNGSLEKKLAEWPERYAVAGAAVKSLQQRLEESKHSSIEKDALAARLKTRVRQLEEAAQKACRETDEKEARREREYKMLQDLLAEYDSLVKEHEGVKNNLISTENKLVDANDEISELKRVISKLELQVKQLEHENQARARFASHSNAQPSGAGLFHHPDLLLSPSKCKAEPDVTYRKSPCLLSEQLNGGRKSPFPHNQSSSHKKSYCSLRDQSAKSETPVDTCSAAGSWRCSSPPQCESSQPQARHQDQNFGKSVSVRREGSCTLTPMMRALIELEETRATASRAPWVGHQRTTVGFVERKHKESIQEQVRLSAERDVAKPVMVSPELRGERCHPGAERAAALLRAQRSLSPDSHRSSSLPPPAQRNIPAASPTKRETLLMPQSAKSSPKRCPTENYSTAFGHMMPREEHLVRRFDGQVDQRRHSFHSSRPRKRLQFQSADAEDDVQQPESAGYVNPPEGDSQLGWEEQGAGRGADLQNSCEDSTPLHSLADAERLFDELTQEKLQIEAALSRMPGAGGRVSLQTRLDEVALEKRLEALNRELGSIRMTLKRFHVLRSSANI